MKVLRHHGLLSRALSQRPTASSVARSDLPLTVALAFAVALVVCALLFLAWVRTAELRLGYELHSLRTDVLRLRHERTELAIEVQSLKRPERLDAIAREKLSLFPPSARRTISLDGDVVEGQGEPGAHPALAGGRP